MTTQTPAPAAMRAAEKIDGLFGPGPAYPTASDMAAIIDDEIRPLLDLLECAREEFRLIRSKDGAGPYDPTLNSRIEIALSQKAEGRDE